MNKNSSDERRLLMLEAPAMRIIPSMALPTIIAMIVDSLYNLADTFFVSGLGETATAAVAVNDAFMNILVSIGAAYAFGAGSFTARLLGAKEDKHASEVASTALACSIMTAVFFILVLWPIRKSLVFLFGSTQEAAQYSIDYATWILFAFPFTASTAFLNQMHKSEGNTSYAMIGTVSGCVINCALDPLFINVFGLEVAGAAIATALSKVISATVLAVPYIKKNTVMDIAFSNIKFNKADAAEVAKIGSSTFLRMSLMSFGAILSNNAAKVYGTAALAAISIVTKLYRFVSAVIMGFAQGASPIIGYCYGAKGYKRVKELYYSTCMIGFAFGIFISIAMWFGAEWMVNIFNKAGNPTVTEIGVFKMHVLCLGYIPHVFTLITNHVFQALGRSVGNLILSLSRQVLFLIPLVLILPKYYGVYGVAAAQGTADMLAGVLIAVPCAINTIKFLNRLDRKQMGNI